MGNVEQDHHKEHEDCVEAVQENLMAQKVAIVPLLVLHNPEEGSDQDEDACRIQGVKVASPWHQA